MAVPSPHQREWATPRRDSTPYKVRQSCVCSVGLSPLENPYSACYVHCPLTYIGTFSNQKLLSPFHPPPLVNPTDALAKNFASQCGYCTPGFTVALAAAAAAASSEAGGGACAAPCHNGDGSGGGVDRPSAVNLALGLDGNLCRCTGWRPIIDTCRVRVREGDTQRQRERGGQVC